MPQETKTYCCRCVTDQVSGLLDREVGAIEPLFHFEVVEAPGKGEGAVPRGYEDWLCEVHFLATLKAAGVKREELEPLAEEDEEEDDE